MRIVAGLYKNRPLIAPKGLETRPTSSKLREALFNICQHYTEDSQFLDLFAGSGAMGLEAMSRGAQHATFIDSDKEASKAIQANIKSLNLEESTRVISTDVFKGIGLLIRQGKQFDIIYTDPPYANPLSSIERIMQKIEEGSLLKQNGMLFIELAAGTDIEAIKLNSLRLLSSRKMGRSVLLQYQKVTE